MTPDEFHEDGDTVIVLSHSEAKAKETGKEVKLPWVHTFRFGDGKVTEVQALTDTALAADALGSEALERASASRRRRSGRRASRRRRSRSSASG